jgi:hypothetical protein
MTANNRKFAFVLAAAVALAPVVARATISTAKSFDDKVENASSIVLGRCLEQQSRWDENHKLILTYTTFRVEKMIKGQPAQDVTVVTPGGVVGTTAQDVVGVPRFAKGDDHVVFVRNTRAGPTVLYFEQGAYRVESDGGERMVMPLVSSAVLVDTQRGVAVAPERPRTLREFENHVRETVRRREIAKMEMIVKAKQKDASVASVLRRNWLVVTLALLGALLATWQFAKRW